MAEHAGWDSVRSVSEVVIAPPNDFGDTGQRASTRTGARQQGHLITEVVADEWERPVAEPGGQRSRSRLIWTNREARLIDPL
jgi:hypothetical protein